MLMAWKVCSWAQTKPMVSKAARESRSFGEVDVFEVYHNTHDGHPQKVYPIKVEGEVVRMGYELLVATAVYGEGNDKHTGGGNAERGAGKTDVGPVHKNHDKGYRGKTRRQCEAKSLKQGVLKCDAAQKQKAGEKYQ